MKKETLAQVFSRIFCEISKNTFFTEHLWATASEKRLLKLKDLFYKEGTTGRNSYSQVFQRKHCSENSKNI